MSDQTTGRRRTSPLDDDDLLSEILLRLPSQPSSLTHASLVCKRWRRLVSDPCFLRCLCAHHKKPPLLGFFFEDWRPQDVYDLVFDPILETPDRIPLQRFALPAATGSSIRLLGCRHGRVLLLEGTSGMVLVCDPVTGGHVRLAIPPEFTNQFIHGMVLCAADEQGHVHGACNRSPFKVVLIGMSTNDRCPMACVYTSETGLWGNIIVHDRPGTILVYNNTSTLIGHALYWAIVTYGSKEEVEDDDVYLRRFGVLEFDLDRQTITVIKGPPMVYWSVGRIINAVDGGVDLATLSYRTSPLQLWHLNVNGHGVATWVLVKTVDLRNIFGLQKHEILPVSRRRCSILGYDEDDGVILIYVDFSLLMLQLDSMQFKRCYENTQRGIFTICHPFRSFYPAGEASAVRSDGD